MNSNTTLSGALFPRQALNARSATPARILYRVALDVYLTHWASACHPDITRIYKVTKGINKDGMTAKPQDRSFVLPLGSHVGILRCLPPSIHHTDSCHVCHAGPFHQIVWPMELT